MILDRFLEWFAPTGLYQRFLLIVLLPVVLMQAIAVYIFYERHWDSISLHMNTALAGEIAQVIDLIQRSPESAQPEILNRAFYFLQLDASIKHTIGPLPPLKATSQQFNDMILVLQRYISYPFYIEDQPEESRIFFTAQLPQGQLYITVPRKRLFNPTTYIFILWMIGSACLLVLISILFLRNQTRSIARLAAAAEALGKGRDVQFMPQGASEVRQAGFAFLEMKERIQRQVSQRTAMLAGVSHDLRTPLTRMKLQLALLPKAKMVPELEKDVDEMERMLESYLNFVRGAGEEKTRKLELKSFLKEVTGNYRRQYKRVTLGVKSDAAFRARPIALTRALNNLIDNALRYGTRVRITAEKKRRQVKIVIEDNGPGIPEAERISVFQPFYRLEESRNIETGGAGLGLSIVRDIIHSHGGEISLSQSRRLGGLRAVIVLPV